MISIKKFLDEHGKPTSDQQSKQTTKEPIIKAPQQAGSVIEDFRLALFAVAKNIVRDGSAHGEEAAKQLDGLARRIGVKPSPSIVHESEAELETTLDVWGKRSALDAKAKADGVKELLLALAKTGEAIDSRNQKHASRLSTLTGQLAKIGDLNEVSQIRSTLIEHVNHLRSSVEEMNKESKQVVAELESKVTAYEAKLKSVEDLALRDGLTGAANRRCLEERMNSNIERNIQFCIALFDLNRFKAINDNLGHVAGDDVLKQFARILAENSRASDLIGRWGGDEFVLVLSGIEEKARPHILRLKEKVCTRYMVHGKDDFYSPIFVDAAVGLARWDQGESIEQTLAKADVDMYLDKKRMHGDPLT